MTNLGKTTEYTFEAYINSSIECNQSNSVKRAGVMYNADLISVMADQRSNCLFNDRRGVDVASTAQVANAARAD